MASSILIELGKLRVLYDCGRGISQRLVELGLRQDDICHIVLSHFHPDHVSDLIPFLHAASWSRIDPRTADLHIYGPPGTKELIDALTNIFGAHCLARDTFTLHIHEVRGEHLIIDGLEFEFIELPPANNHGLRFEYHARRYAFTGDSNFHEQEVSFLSDADWAVIDSGHLSDDEIVELAVRSRAKNIICSHLYRELDAAALNSRAQARGFPGELFVGDDLLTISCPR
jgi:ribonuclease BN (tRNA processing enzyme)